MYVRIRKNIFLICIVEDVLILYQDMAPLTAIFPVSGFAKMLPRSLHHTVLFQSQLYLEEIEAVLIRSFPKCTQILRVQN